MNICSRNFLVAKISMFYVIATLVTLILWRIFKYLTITFIKNTNKKLFQYLTDFVFNDFFRIQTKTPCNRSSISHSAEVTVDFMCRNAQ